MNYMKGDKVRIIATHYGHGFKIGSKVKIVRVLDFHYRAERKGFIWSIKDDEIICNKCYKNIKDLLDIK